MDGKDTAPAALNPPLALRAAGRMRDDPSVLSHACLVNAALALHLSTRFRPVSDNTDQAHRAMHTCINSCCDELVRILLKMETSSATAKLQLDGNRKRYVADFFTKTLPVFFLNLKKNASKPENKRCASGMRAAMHPFFQQPEGPSFQPTS